MVVGLDVPELDPQLVAGVLEVLADYNARTWDCVGTPGAACLAPPWRLRYVPDAPGPRVLLRDANALMRRGYGSCGELAAAYAGFLRAAGHAASLEVVVTKLDEHRRPLMWHATARVGDRVLDPATLGTH